MIGKLLKLLMVKAVYSGIFDKFYLLKSSAYFVYENIYDFAIFS